MARTVHTAFVALILVSLAVGQVVAEPRRERPGSPRARLNLNEQQEAKLRQALQKTRGESEKTSRALMEERRRLFTIYDDYHLNQSRARNAIGRINRLQVELLNLSLERQLAIRRVLSPDDFRQLGRAGGPGPGSGRGPGHDRIGDIPDPEAGPRGRRLPQLNLDPEQQQAIERLWQKSNRDSDDTFGDMGSKLRAIDRLYDEYRLDEKAARRLISDINRSQRQLMLSRLDWQIQMRKILSEQQFKALARQTPKPPFSGRPGKR